MSALLITLLIYGTGLGWLWATPPLRDHFRWVWLHTLATGLCLGLIPTLLLCTGFAEFGHFGSFIMWTAVAAVPVIGLIVGLRREKRVVRRRLLDALPGFALILISTFAIFSHQQTSEWIVGGLDPGVYMNEGLVVAGTGTFHPEAQDVHAQLEKDDLETFSRPLGSHVEVFPGVPLDPTTRQIDFYFFRVYPTFIALLHSCGGVSAAFHANEIAGLVGLVIFAAFMMLLTRSTSVSLTSVLLLATQSIWIHHLHTPVSEMLQLALLFGIGLNFLAPHRTLLMNLLLAANAAIAVMTRFDFLLFGSLLLFAKSWMDIQSEDKKHTFHTQLWLLSGLAMGAAYDMLFCSITIEMLGSVLGSILLVAAFSVCAMLVLNLPATRKPALRVLSVKQCFLLMWTTIACLIVGAFVFGLPLLAEFRWNTPRLAAYFEVTLLATAGSGLVVLSIRRNELNRCFAGWILFLAGACCLVLLYDYIVNRYPWALRRHLVFTVPLMAMLASSFVSWLWKQRVVHGYTGRVAAVLTLAAILCSSAGLNREAWNNTEYQGILGPLSSISDQLADDDIIVADHFWWGTPLALAFHHQVLNGEYLWNHDQKENAFRRALEALRTLHDKGYRIRFLTSTSRGLSVYPDGLAAAQLDWQHEEIRYQEMIHHVNASGFERRTRRKPFRLYTWTPGAP